MEKLLEKIKHYKDRNRDRNFRILFGIVIVLTVFNLGANLFNSYMAFSGQADQQELRKAQERISSNQDRLEKQQLLIEKLQTNQDESEDRADDSDRRQTASDKRQDKSDVRQTKSGKNANN